MPLIKNHKDDETHDLQSDMTTVYGWHEIKYLGLICLGIILFQIFTTLAFIKEKAARVAPIGAFQLIINCAVDIFILNRDKPVKYNQVIGAFLIFCSNITLSILKC